MFKIHFPSDLQSNLFFLLFRSKWLTRRDAICNKSLFTLRIFEYLSRSYELKDRKSLLFFPYRFKVHGQRTNIGFAVVPSAKGPNRKFLLFITSVASE